ncbi:MULTISPECIES: GDSL-type esterase/lipase family protein [unclassified Schaalia]|uniref:GDSL-type esterase/lipase family protein n=1 Tax=unclassified Schaalia TaxID=2691889 RepID=UPI001E5171C0|nr:MULTISPECIES: GDSL-type esterase/lipase family protein [unclassified Schaalia]MCD4549720.1 GDSL-type esterase/lipase family protein [Schaalia sp. lx-260]MCD4556736.1 GDSL-type esterase/lipase family protein [Schaalia sp. lx-100]
MRICVVGDELVAGVGDPRGQGWVGRVIARSDFQATPTVMSLAVPGENTSGLAARWENEVLYRLGTEGPRALVIAVGTGDVFSGLSTARTRLNLANMTDRATALGIPSFVIGPPPLAGVDHTHVKNIVHACAQVCERRSLPFVDTFTPLVAHEQWFEDMAASCTRSESGVTLPGQAGYALISWLVLHCGWYEWMGAQPLP